MLMNVDLVPQKYKLLETVDGTTMLGNKRPTNHDSYKIGDTIRFREYYGAEGPWGGIYGSGKSQDFKVIKIEDDPETATCKPREQKVILTLERIKPDESK